MNFSMTNRVEFTALFEKEVKRLSKKYASLKADIISLISSLKENPEQGVALGKGLFKIRLAIESKGKGKSGGARVITYWVSKDNVVYLTSIYDKSEQDSINVQAMLKSLKEANIS